MLNILCSGPPTDGGNFCISKLTFNFFCHCKECGTFKVPTNAIKYFLPCPKHVAALSWEVKRSNLWHITTCSLEVVIIFDKRHNISCHMAELGLVTIKIILIVNFLKIND